MFGRRRTVVRHLTVRSFSLSGASHCREVLTVRCFSLSGGLTDGSVQVLLLLIAEAEQFGPDYDNIWFGPQACDSEKLWIV